MTAPSDNKPRSLRLSDQLMEGLRIAAGANRRTVSAEAQVAIERHLARAQAEASAPEAALG